MTVEEKEIQEIDEVEVVKHLKYSSCGVKFMYGFIFTISFVTNIDHGALPAALSNISKDLEFSE